MDSNNNSRIICNICNIADASPVIHCSVCCNAFHYKCTFPGVPASMYDHLVNMLGIQWYCPTDRDLSVSKLLDRLSLMERKLMERPSSFDDVFCGAITKPSHTKTSPLPVIPESSVSTGRRILRSKRNATADIEEIPKKKPRENKTIKSTPSSSGAKAVSPAAEYGKPPEAGPPAVAIAFPSVAAKSSEPITTTLQRESSSSVPSSATNKDLLRVVPPVKKTAAIVQPSGSVDNMLVVVPPNRSIFLSRLGLETSVDDIKQYISDKLAISTGFGIRKFESHGSTFSSFLLRCDDSIYETLLNSKNWPRNMKVERFFQRRSHRKQRS